MSATPNTYDVAAEYAALCKRQDAAKLLAEVVDLLGTRLVDLEIFTKRLPQADANECRDIIREVRVGLSRIHDKYTKA